MRYRRGFWGVLPGLPVLLVILPMTLPASDASVSGTVVDDSTSKPIHTAYVTLSTTGSKPMDASVYTDVNGAFQFSAVPPGRYYLHAGEDRYQHVSLGAPTPDRYPAALTLGPGEIRQGIELRMKRLCAVSGLVLDPDGDPMTGIGVQLMVATWARGHKTWTPRKTAATNARGEFRIHGIIAGRYFLCATARRMPVFGMRSEVALGDSEPDQVFGKIYYPNAANIQNAQPLELKPGAEIQGIALQLPTTAAATITGHVEAPEGLDTSAGFQVIFNPRDDSAGTSAGYGIGGGQQLIVPALAPGRYTAVTTLQGNDEYRGVDDIDLQPGPQNVVFHLQKGVRLAGHLEVQGAEADLTSFKVTLISGDVSPRSGRNNLEAVVQKDGTFAFASVTSGIWDISVQSVPKGGYIKSMKLGEQDVLTEDMNITSATNAPLNIVVSGRGGVVTGTVKMPERSDVDIGAGEPRAVVLLTPAGRLSHVESFRMIRSSEQDGKYELRGITPASYKLFAFEALDRTAVRDPDFLSRIDSLGKPVEVREDEEIKLDLDMLPAPPAATEQ
jgi:hypothetical protein